ncbi:sensor histidine kinase [Azohydromonas australica]|uniref:sensor histidine kinase n=1 Tax=Azohydromonas australica TaxID=364039 RepID=UPI0003F89630|nr:HAMP domain-containing sensor histidine kinase [Azohydromonas australica]
MKREGSLRGRVVAAFTLVAIAVGVFFAFVGFHTVEQVESRLIGARLGELAQWQLQRLRAGQEPALPPGLRLYLGEQVPQALRQLPPGFHDIDGPATTLDAFAGTTDDGRPYVLVDEESDFETIEQELVSRLATGLLAAVALAAALGWAVAGREIAPLTALAEAVRHKRLDAAAPALARDDEIGVLGRALAAHTAELQEFLHRERLFTGDVSHELRTPLTVILGAAEVLGAQCADRPALLATVERIHRTAQDTADRVGALLLLSRAPQAISAPRIALRPLVEREMERCRPLLRGRGVELALDAPGEVWVFAQPELAAMAIGNLLRNACLYTEHGRIDIRLAPVGLDVVDTGPGLPPAVRAQLFERFVRGDAQATSGAGLGLALVKRITEHLGWSVELVASDAGGSHFRLRFPG